MSQYDRRSRQAVFERATHGRRPHENNASARISGSALVILGPEWEHEPFFITGIDLRGRPTASEELMRLLALTIATASVLAFAFPQTPRVLAQGSDSGAVGRPLQLDGGPSLGSDNRGQSSGGGSERTEPSVGVRSEKSQTQIGKTSETTVRGRSRSRIGWSSRPRHRFVFHRRGHHLVAFNGPRHRFVIHRHGRRYVAFTEPGA